MDWGSTFSQALPSLSGLTGGGGTGFASSAPVGGGHQPAQTGTQPHTIGVSSPATTHSQATGYAPTFQWTSAASVGSQPKPAEPLATPPASLRNHTVEEIVAKHNQDILNRILTQTEEKTRKATDEYIESQINSMFEQDRSVWLEEIVGYRSIGGGSAYRGKNELLTGSAETQLLLPASTGSGSTWSQNHAFAMDRPGRHGRREGYLDTEFANMHFHALLKSSIPSDMAKSFKSIATNAVNTVRDPTHQHILDGYSSAWDLTSKLLEVGPRFSPVDLASATLVHFCTQFENVLNERVYEGIKSGAVTESPPFSSKHARDCRLFVYLTFGTNANVWTTLYYCLRIGDAKAALDVWTNMADPCLSDTHRDAIASILKSMIVHNADQCLWENGIPSLPTRERRALEEMIDRQDSSNDIHQKGVLTLLTGYQDLPTDEATPGFSAIEDYLFGRLWKAQLSENPIDELTRFGNEIQANSSYFQDEPSKDSGGWTYTLPLLASQQYARALSHLAESGKDVLLQSTHLAMVWAEGGVPISDLGQETPRNPRVLSRIVESYAITILPVQGLGTLASLEYLARIPDKMTAVKAVAKLIVDTGDLEEIAGYVDGDGLRRPSETSRFDHHFSHEEMTLVLKEAAEQCLRNRSDDEKTKLAVKCYLQARAYDKLVELLNKKLSPPNDVDASRGYWIRAYQEFQEKFVETRTSVYLQLQNENKLGLVEAGNKLVKLNRFFQNLRTAKYEQAWSEIKDIGLVPSTEDELNEKVRFYRMNNEDSIRRCYPAVLTGAMESLYHQHVSMKKETSGSSGTVVLERSKQLRMHGSLLVKFAGLIDTRTDQMDSLSHIQALMI